MTNTKFYRVNQYRNRRPAKRWKHPYSVDQVTSDGQYISQEAYWYDFSDDAREALAKLIADDAKLGIASADCGQPVQVFQ